MLGYVLVFLSMILVGLIRAIRDRRPTGDRNPAPRGARAANRIILGICILNLLFLAGVALWIMPMAIVHPLRFTFKIVLGLGALSALLTASALVYTVLVWKDHSGSLAMCHSLCHVHAASFSPLDCQFGQSALVQRLFRDWVVSGGSIACCNS
jgi:hypothetical protein